MAELPKAPGSVLGASSLIHRRGLGGDFEFNLGQTKARVFKELDEKTPPTFRKFFQSALYDRMLQTILLYFTTTFQAEWVVKTMEKSRKQNLEGYNPYVVAARLNELDEEIKQLRQQISPVYSEIILKHSSYKQPQQDKLFFEAMYETLIQIVDEAFSKQNRRPDIEREVGQLFRSKHFNVYDRKNLPSRSVDSLTVKELYSIKHETENRALNSKLLSSLYEKPVNLGMMVASVSNSPLITQYITSPIVARAMMKDPDLRRSSGPPAQATTSLHGEEAGRMLTSVFKSAAMLRGADPSKMPAEMPAQPASEADEIGSMPAERSRKPEEKKGKGGISVPEAAGLPTDEAFAYLTMLKRYVLYGPQMGLGGAGLGPGPTALGTMGTSGRQHLDSSSGGGAASPSGIGREPSPTRIGEGTRLLQTMTSLQKGRVGS